MRGRAGWAGLAAAVGVCVFLAGGCSADETAPVGAARDEGSGPSSPGRPALQPVSLPDLSQITESEFLREQIRQQYASLRRTADNPETTPIELSHAFGEMGKLFMAAEYVDAAESCYLNAQALAPRERRWPYYLGHVYRTKGALVKAAAFFEQALQLQPDDVPTLVWLGEMHLAKGRPEAAEPPLERALALQPRSVAARFGLGRAALTRKDYARAVRHLEEALALDQQAGGVYYALSMAYRGLGELQKAEAHLRQQGAVGIRPAPHLPPDPLMEELEELVQSALAYEVRGARAVDKGDYALAAAYFRRGLELAPASPSLRHRLGTVLVVMGDVQGGLKQFEEVVRRSPRYAKAHYSLGVLLEASGRNQEAIDRFSAAVRHQPSYTEARSRLAGLLRRSGRPHEAMSQYEQIIRIDPRVSEAPFGYAMALVSLGRHQEARDRLTEGMKAYPDELAFIHALARLLAAAPDDRVRDGRRAMTVMQTLSDAEGRSDLGEIMAMTLAELGQYEEAAAWQREAIAGATRTGRDDLAQRMAENLKLYEARKPCRTPWRNGELP